MLNLFKKQEPVDRLTYMEKRIDYLDKRVLNDLITEMDWIVEYIMFRDLDHHVYDADIVQLLEQRLSGSEYEDTLYEVAEECYDLYMDLLYEMVDAYIDYRKMAQKAEKRQKRRVMKAERA